MISQKRTALSASIPAPVGGWNARDALGEMAPTDAVILTNWFPTPSDVIQRYGYTKHATGISGQVETVMAYSGLTANKLLAAAGTAIYDVTSGGAVGAAVQSGLTNARWQYVNYANTSGNYLYMVNGADAPRYWDGTTWTNAAITNVTPANLIHINEHKNRLWFVEKNTLNAWYLATSAIAGAATKFDLTGIAMKGGYLMAMGTWTLDAGYGVDDLAAFITSQGEVIVYRGTDPSSANTWALVGVWQIGSPIGRRCLMKFAGDMLVICQDGLYPMSGALQSSRLDPRVALTDKIQFATSQAISSYGANFGWQCCPFPKENMLILNVPVMQGSQQQQYVMNTITKAWCNFTGWEANCWELFNDDPYFGGNGYVGHAWYGNADNGANVACDGLQAFNYFNSRGLLKRFTMMRPVIQTSGVPSIGVAMNIDFNTADTTSPLSFSPTTYGLWDSGVWDTSVWGADLVVTQAWQGVNGVGYCAAPRLKVASQGIQTQWVSTDVVFEKGGIL